MNIWAGVFGLYAQNFNTTGASVADFGILLILLERRCIETK
jgi:hypothetical protein